MTHTFAVLEISAAAYAEIRKKLLAAGYEHTVMDQDDGEVIDMHGIAVRAEAPKERERPGESEEAYVIALNVTPELRLYLVDRGGLAWVPLTQAALFPTESRARGFYEYEMNRYGSSALAPLADKIEILGLACVRR